MTECVLILIYFQTVEGKSHRLPHHHSDSEDSIECMYMCDKDPIDEVSDLRPLTSPTHQPDQPDLDSDTECHQIDTLRQESDTVS